MRIYSSLIRNGFMKIVKSTLLLFSLLGMIASNANADILFTQKGQPTGYLIKVIQEGNQVSYQLYAGSQYIKNLGDQNHYDSSKVIAYSRSLPAQVSYDHTRRVLFKVGGTILGLAGGVFVTKLIAKSNQGGGSEGFLSGLGSAIAGLIAIGPSLAIGGFGGYFGGGALESYYFVGAEEHELRATLTSEAMLKNDRVVLEVKDALKAANELDQALKEIR